MANVVCVMNVENLLYWLSHASRDALVLAGELVYGTYCPPDIRVDRGDARDGLDLQQVHVHGVALKAAATPDNAMQMLPPLPDEPYPSLAHDDRSASAVSGWALCWRRYGPCRSGR
jgi:hypothetical protein